MGCIDCDTMGNVKDLDIMLGEPRKAVTMMAVPLILSYAVAQINTFADTAWCAGLGADASTALSLVMPFYWIISGIGTGIGVGAAAAIARHLGRRERDEAESLVLQTVVLSLITGAVCTPLLLISVDPLLGLMSLGDVEHLCEEYILPIVFSSTAFVLNGAVVGLLRSEGAANRSMMVLVSGAALNIILDPIMIYVLDMGLAGAAFATIASTAASMIPAFRWYLSGRMYLGMDFRDYVPRVDQMADILSVGIPRMVEMFFISILSVVQRIILVPRFGVMASAMYSVPWSYVSLIIVISQAVGAAIIPICSASVGVRDPVKAGMAYRHGLMISMVSMGAMAFIVLLAADYLMIPFAMDDSLLEYRGIYAYGLRVYMVCIPFLCLIDVCGSFMQSMRHAKIPMLTALARNVFLVSVLTACTTMELVYWAVFATEVIGGLLNLMLASWTFSRFKRFRCRVAS